MIDIFSRYIVGAIVHACEDGLLAKEMMTDAFGIHGTPEVVHSDGGPSMTSKTVRTRPWGPAVQRLALSV